MSHDIYDNRHYVIIASGDVPLINFDEVMETSAATLRYSVDGTKTFVKYDGAMPISVASCTSKSQEYSHEEILTILSGNEWTSPMEMP